MPSPSEARSSAAARDPLALQLLRIAPVRRRIAKHEQEAEIVADLPPALVREGRVHLLRGEQSEV